MFTPRSRGLASVALLLVGCAALDSDPLRNAHVVPALPAAPRPRTQEAVTSSSSAFESQLQLRLVASLGYPVRLLPLGASALVFTGEWHAPLPLIIDGNQLTFRTELTRFDAPPRGPTSLWVAGGSWPDNVWLAMSYPSDAGPCVSDVYHLGGASWVKMLEHSSCVGDLKLWRNDPVLVGTTPNIPVLTTRAIARFSKAGIEQLVRDTCDFAAPASSRDGVLSVFSTDCAGAVEPGFDGPFPDRVRIDTWSAAAPHSTAFVPLDGLSVERVLVDAGGPAFLLRGRERGPARLARYVGDHWRTLAEVPEDFSSIEASGALALWGVSRGQLLYWDNDRWARTRLPAPQAGTQITWSSVWRRGPSDVWLVGESTRAGSSQKTSLLFNTADGSAKLEQLPAPTAREGLAQAIFEPEQPSCPHPFADVLKQSPFQLGADVGLPFLTDAEVVHRLKRLLLTHPEFGHLRFVGHQCYGEACVGAQFQNLAELERFLNLLPRDGYRGDRVSCLAPPNAKPLRLRP
jgi:hypothetical protein